MTLKLLFLTILSSSIVCSEQCEATKNADGLSTVQTMNSTISLSTILGLNSTSPTKEPILSACSTCTTDLISIIRGNDGDAAPLIATGTDANDCVTVTYTCERTPFVDADVVLLTLYTEDQKIGNSRSINGRGSAKAQLTCVDGAWEFEGLEISSVECQIIE